MYTTLKNWYNGEDIKVLHRRRELTTHAAATIMADRKILTITIGYIILLSTMVLVYSLPQ